MRKYLVATSAVSLLAGVLAVLMGGPAIASQAHAHRRYGTVTGAAELCVPADPTARSSKAVCHVFTKKWSGCTDHVCRTLDRAAVRNSAAKIIAEVPLKRGRFAVRLSPGTYTVELLFTAKHRDPVVAQPTLQAKVRAGETTRLVFRGYAG